MFKRLTTSLTKPPLAVFFMKDSWGKVILYLILLPTLLMLPAWLKILVNPGMSLDRYQQLMTAIEKDLTLSNTLIVDGTLITTETAKTQFEHFEININSYEPTQDKIHFVFLSNDLAIYVIGTEITRASYETIGLENYDFSDTTSDNRLILASGIRALYEENAIFTTSEIFLAYFKGLFDFVFYALIMTLFMMIFTRALPIPFGMRFKLSIYLTTIAIFIELLALLFSTPALTYLAIPILYIWHFWAYKSIKVIDKGLTI